jgi:hypothetical protein
VGMGSAEASATAIASVAATARGTVAGLPDPCSLLNPAEIQGVLGSAVQAGVPDGSANCRWEKADLHKITVAIHLLVLPGSVTCQIAASTPVDGLGVPAAWHYVSAAETGSIVACPTGRQVQITLVGDLLTHTTTEADLKAKATQLMTIVLPRIG